MVSLHPQTRAAWARAFAPRPTPPRYDHRARAAARYERTWDAIMEAHAIETLRRRCRTGAAQRDDATAQAAKARAEAAEKARQEAALAEHRARFAAHGAERGASPEARASAWLAFRDADSSFAASQAVLVVVRGFGLGERDGRALIEAEYEPRFYRKFARGELDGWIRRAMRASKPWGWMLNEDRRRAG